MPDPQQLAIWLTVSVVFNVGAGLIILCGSIWSAFRELHIRDARNKSNDAMREVALGLSNLTLVGDTITQRIADMNNLSREERRDLISMLREYKREQIELLIDIEKRLTREIDQTQKETHGATVSVHGGLNNIGQTEIQGNQRQQ